MSTSVSVPALPSAVATFLFRSLPPDGDRVVLDDEVVAEAVGRTVPVYRWALRELEAVGFLKYQRLAKGRHAAREIRVDLGHWLITALGLASATPTASEVAR